MNCAPVVMVTGAARRIGAEIVRTLHAAGANVVVHYRSSEADAKALTSGLNDARENSAICIQADLNDTSGIATLVSRAADSFGRLDVLVNNASTFYSAPLGKVDEVVWDDMIGSNLKAPFFLAQAAASYLTDVRGCIVNICDIHGDRPLKGYVAYCAAKAGLLGLTRALALELGPYVRVNGVSPGPIIWPTEYADFSPTERASIENHTLLKRIGEPKDIALAVKYLVFEAPYVTGQIINVDGGRTAHL